MSTYESRKAGIQMDIKIDFEKIHRETLKRMAVEDYALAKIRINSRYSHHIHRSNTLYVRKIPSRTNKST